jgi:hypothetical protein
VPNSIINSNTTASAREGARGKHASVECNIYLGKYSAAKHVVLYILV